MPWVTPNTRKLPARMQTKQQIQQLLASAGISPKKRLGLLKLLIDSARISNTDTVLEVGCGTGSLTEALARRAGKVIAVELDPTLAGIAKTQLARAPNVEIINTDILKNKNTINPAVTNALQLDQKKCAGRILLVTNLPYNAASPVIINLLTGPTKADAMCVTVQKELARRITASPGSSHYGTLSILLSATGDVKMIRTLKPAVFWPQPQVDSAIVSFIRKKDKARRIQSMHLFNKIVNLFMQHRRKTVRTCTKFAADKLAEIHNWPEIFEQSCINPTFRPEKLSPENYIALANICHKHLNPKRLT